MRAHHNIIGGRFYIPALQIFLYINYDTCRQNAIKILRPSRCILYMQVLWSWYYMECHNSIYIQYIPRNMHTVFALLCFVVFLHWLIFPYPSGLLHWHCGNLTIAPVPAKQPWWIWINTSCEFIMNDCITTTKQSTTKPCAYFLRYTVVTKCIRVSFTYSDLYKRVWDYGRDK